MTWRPVISRRCLLARRGCQTSRLAAFSPLRDLLAHLLLLPFWNVIIEKPVVDNARRTSTSSTPLVATAALIISSSCRLVDLCRPWVILQRPRPRMRQRMQRHLSLSPTATRPRRPSARRDPPSHRMRARDVESRRQRCDDSPPNPANPPLPFSADNFSFFTVRRQTARLRPLSPRSIRMRLRYCGGGHHEDAAFAAPVEQAE